MKSWPAKAFFLAGAASLLLALPALGQESEAPESLLPPGFGDPESLPPPVDEPPPRTQLPPPPSVREISPSELEEEEEAEELDEEDLRPLNYFTIPEGTARPIEPVGPLVPGNFGLAPNAFGRSSGPFLATLMSRLDAPLPSRWTSILLRRALLSRLPVPRGIHPVDWVAARADLLLRMGEADAARMLVQSIDREFYTPRMIEAAARTALATADPAGLCPLVDAAPEDQAVWTLASAMCAALEGEPARASALVDEARRSGNVGGVDFLLAEKVIGAGTGARRAANLDWEEVDRLDPWRAGLAGATGAEIPPRLVSGAAPQIQAWIARAPMIPLEQRLGAAATAASLGVFSSRSLVEIYSLMLDQTDPAEVAGTVGARLRTAWVESDPGDRLVAMRSLWAEPEGGRERHARLILTSGAAARIPASPDFAADAPNLIAAMLSAGMDRPAARWGAVVMDSGENRSWAMLALAAPEPAVEISAERLEAFFETDDSARRRRSQLLIAALAGLGRIAGDDAATLAAAAGVDLGRTDRWTGAIDRAARAREPGTVALLAGVGMQTGGWGGVSPAYLFRTVRALRTVGLEYEARMIAAEAMARL